MRRSTSRRRPAKKKTTRRRRRVSGINMSGGIMDAALIVGGALAAREISNVWAKQSPGTSNYIIGAAQLGIGYMLPKFWRSPMAKSVGSGMIAMGGFAVLSQAGFISGVGDRVSYRINGTDKLKAIAGGTDRLRAVSGLPMQQNYRKGFADTI